MRSRICRVACIMALVLSPFLTAQNANRWAKTYEGTYFYARNTAAPVPFTLDLQVNGTSVWGRTSEPATFGDGSSAYLYANISGTISGLNISFVKTYDGTGGPRHSVQYQRTLTSALSSMSGRWQVGSNEGSFRATAK